MFDKIEEAKPNEIKELCLTINNFHHLLEDKLLGDEINRRYNMIHLYINNLFDYSKKKKEDLIEQVSLIDKSFAEIDFMLAENKDYIKGKK